MKPSIKLLIITLVITNVTFNQTLGQSTDIGNERIPGLFLGWDNTGTAGSLEIRNDFNESIYFKINTTNRAKIDSLGKFGIGISLPLRRLHVRDNTTLVLDTNYTPYATYILQTTYAGLFVAANPSAQGQSGVMGRS